MMRRNLPDVLDGQPDRIERAEEQPVRLLGRDQLGRDDRDLLAVGRDGAGQQELLAGDRRDPGDQIAELRVRLEIQLHDPLARRELLAGVEVLLADQLGRAGDARRAAARAACPPASSPVAGAAPGAGGAGGRRLPSRRPGQARERRGVRGVPGGGVGAGGAAWRRRGRRRLARLDPDRLAVGSGHHRRAQRARAQEDCNHRRDTLCRSSVHRML